MATLLNRYDKDEKRRAAARASRWAEQDRKTKEAWDAWKRFLDEKGERDAAIDTYRRRIRTVPYIHTPEQWKEACEYNNVEYKKIQDELHGDPTIRFRLDILRALRLPLPIA